MVFVGSWRFFAFSHNFDEIRKIEFHLNVNNYAEGSCLAKFGNTHVLCTATIDERVPMWLKNKGTGWVTAEYSMLPGSSPERIRRETKGPKGRTQEIQRLIGRSLRAVCDMEKLGERQVTVDCDVLQADGGTRVASICGGFLALHDALSRLQARKQINEHPILEACAAVSVGIINGAARLDLPYEEDSKADTDMNVVMTESGEFIEIQGTAEKFSFSKDELSTLLTLAEKGINEIIALQKELLKTPPQKR